MSQNIPSPVTYRTIDAVKQPSLRQMLRKPPPHQLLIRRPNGIGDLLRYLEPLRGIDLYPLQIADHDIDHALQRDLFRGIILKRDLGRSNEQVLVGPVLFKGGITAPLHIRLLYEEEGLRMKSLVG